MPPSETRMIPMAVLIALLFIIAAIFGSVNPQEVVTSRALFGLALVDMLLGVALALILITRGT